MAAARSAAVAGSNASAARSASVVGEAGRAIRLLTLPIDKDA
jgi:hypothetical protein